MHGYALPLDGADCRGCELADGIRPNQHAVSNVDDAGLHDSRDDGADEGHGEGVIDGELEGRVGVVVAVRGQDV